VRYTLVVNELIEHLKAIIEFRSVGNDSTEKKRCLDWIWENFLKSSGLTPVRGEIGGAPYLLVIHPHPKLLWFGHIDVVPANDAQFTIKIDGDTIEGRGVKDMKGADLAFLIAYRDACVAGSIPPVSILLTSDEETGGHTPLALLDQGVIGNVPVAFTPDTGEGEGIVTELKGAAWVRVVAEGDGGHGAMPWKTRNPIPLLLGTINTLQTRFPPVAPNEWKMTVTPTQLFGSDATNRIPSEASCILDIRFPPEVFKDPKEALTMIANELPPDVRAELVESAYPTYCDHKHPMVLSLKKIMEDVIGSPVPIRRDHGSSDARYFTARGIPAFLNGPTGGDLHGDREWVSLKSLGQHVEINRRWLRELSSQ
jgi:succinyl-diaminopimelate desuccinylase